MLSSEQFLISDLKIESFLKIIFAVQAIMLGLIFTDILGFGAANSSVLIARQVVGFIYLTFVPGLILLRILGLHYLGLAKGTLYSVGLSIGFSMFIMLLINTILPAFGFLNPLSSQNIIIVLFVSVTILCFASYLKDKDFKVRIEANPKKVSLLALLTVLIFPVASIFGTLLASFYGTNILLLLMLLAISSICVLVAFGKVNPELFPLLVLGIAVALLFQISLVSNYLVGWDSHTEFFFFNSVTANSIWNSSTPFSYNSMLSIVMLPVLYSQFLRINGVWVIKIIYPLIYSLVPLGLYEVYRKQTNAKVAFLAVFFFMSVFTFFNEMPALGREEIAELFIVLLLLLALENNIPSRKRALLFIFFGASLVVSHYGLTYLFFLYLGSALLFVSIMNKSSFTRFASRLFGPLKRISIKNLGVELDTKVKNNAADQSKIRNSITLTFFLFFFVFALVWYIYIANSITFESVVNIGNNIYNGFVSELFVTGTRGASVLNVLGLGSGIVIRGPSRVILYITEFFMVVGVVGYLVKAKRTNFTLEYGGMAITSLAILLVSVALPFFANTLDISRIYQFTTVFLAPFCIVGGATVCATILKRFGHRLHKRRQTYIALLLSAVLILYFLFNTGFIYEVTGDTPSSIALSLGKMNVSNNTALEIWLHGEVDSKQDVFGATWLSENRNASFIVYADLISQSHVLVSYGMIPKNDVYVMSNSTQIIEASYIYLGQLNVKDSIMVNQQSQPWNTTNISTLLQQANLIYSNGAGQVYLYTSNPVRVEDSVKLP